MTKHQLSFQFISEPTDVNFGGKVHGGAVMKWIDQAAYACASAWAQRYCVTVYVGGIRFYRPIHIGDIVRVDARIVYTGRTSMHISIDVFSKKPTDTRFDKTTHCIIVFVALDDEGKPQEVPHFTPRNEKERQLEQYAIKLKDLRKEIEEEMGPFLK